MALKTFILIRVRKLASSIQKYYLELRDCYYMPLELIVLRFEFILK